MAGTPIQDPRAGWVVTMIAALLALCLAALLWPPVTNLLGLVVVAAALVLTPVETAWGSVVAIGLAVLVAVMEPEDLAALRAVNVTIACALAVCISVLLQRRRRGLASSRMREEEILAAMPEAVVLLDAEGVLRRANAGLERLVPAATVGDHLHPLLGHVLADGTECPGGCALAGVRPSTEDYTPVEGERITRDGRPVPVAYTVGRYGEDQVVVTVRDVSVRIAAQQDREVLLQSAARTDEQLTLRRALGGPRLRVSPSLGVAMDYWLPDGQRGIASSGLASVSSLPDGRCLLLMVDADGDGYEPARDAWRALYVARAHLAAGAPLAEMISRASDSLADEADQPEATVVGVVLDPVTGYLQVASGGHPPPLLVLADGSSSWLQAGGRPLGGESPRSVRVAHAELGPGDSLLVYGIGIIDGTRDAVEGMSALRSAAVALRGLPMEGVAERIGRAAVPPGVTREQADSLVMLRLA